jgi:DNA-binding transcriptional LysR family regulator
MVSHGEALRDAIVNELGLAYLSTWLAAEDLRSGRLEVVPIATPAEDVPINALWPHSRALASRVRLVADALVEAFIPNRPRRASCAAAPRRRSGVPLRV